MAINTAPSQVATSALKAIPFETIIGAPLEAAIKAQALAAKTTWTFIKEVGLNGDDDKKEAVNVSFTFQSDGRIARLNVPLLTIIPIPYIAIQNIDINFKASISASSSDVKEESSNETFNAETTTGAKYGWGLWSLNTSFKGGYSSKKDSRATQDSRYSVEYTIDVGVRAGQDSMPAGLAKVLEVLGNSLDISDPNGTLGINTTYFEVKEGEKAKVIATYKAPTGLIDSSQIKCGTDEGRKEGDNKIFDLDGDANGKKHTITAGKLTQEITVKVIKP